MQFSTWYIGSLGTLALWHDIERANYWTVLSDFQRHRLSFSFLTARQQFSIACYAERCLSYDRFCLTDRPTV